MTVSVLWLFLMGLWVGLQCVIVIFPDQTHLIFWFDLVFMRDNAKCKHCLSGLLCTRRYESQMIRI